MGDGGWIKLHRRLMEWEWYKTPNMVHLFTHLILSANHEPGRWQGIDVERGQLITGRKALSAATGISEQSIRSCISKLELTKEVTRKSTKQYTILTICKYDDYQEIEKLVNQRPTNDQPTTNQRPTTNKKDKNEKNEKNNIKKGVFGEFENVFLTDTELKTLGEKFGKTLKDRIESLSVGIASKGYIYKSHFAALIAWSRWETKGTKKQDAEKVPLKEQQAREILGYGAEHRDGETSCFDMEPAIPGSEG